MLVFGVFEFIIEVGILIEMGWGGGFCVFFLWEEYL